MKNTHPYHCFLVMVLIGFLSCNDGLGPNEKNPYQATHQYSPSIKETIPEEKLTEENRWIWQKPELVIEKMGDLNNKTVVDIGAGPYGYFSFIIAGKTMAKKVIAVDIDEEAVTFMQNSRKLLPEAVRDKFETRLVTADDPKIKANEADVVIIVNTVTYIENRINYLKNLRRGIAPDGRLVIIDFKKRNTPIGPNVSERLAVGEIEEDLKKAGYDRIIVDDRTLDYQYIITAFNSAD